MFCNGLPGSLLTLEVQIVFWNMIDLDKYSTTVQLVTLYKLGGMPPRLFDSLLRHFGSIERILRADSGTLMAVAGMSAEAANNIAIATEQLDLAEDYCTRLKERDITITTRFDEIYPPLLFELNDPPPLLYVRGKLPALENKSVAIVGTSKAGNKGIELAARLARELVAKEVRLIASLHTGIAAAAHLASANAEVSSFAVLNGGLDNLDLAEEMPVAIDIAQRGGIVSEFPPEAETDPDNYQAANRLIAGMAQAVVVIEVYHDSEATLDLIKCCSEIGKLTFLMVDPKIGALADEESLKAAATHGAIPMVGWDKVEDIVNSLV